MRYVRFRGPNGVRYGQVEGNSVREIRGSIFRKYQTTNSVHPLSNVKLLAPCEPSKMLAAAVNYKSHQGERPANKVPQLFFKTPSSIIGQGDDIVLPRRAGRVDYEGELVVVIGRRCSNVTRRTAMNYVFGYTCGNDVSAREWQTGDMQWWRAKSSDTFSSFGPWIDTDIDGTNVRLITRLNDKIVQDTNTNLLVHDIPTMISFVSQVMTLEAGDIIYTGTSGTTQPMKPGDVVDVEVEGLGILKNPVVAQGRKR